METLPPRILLIFVHSCTPLTNEEEKERGINALQRHRSTAARKRAYPCAARTRNHPPPNAESGLIRSAPCSGGAVRPGTAGQGIVAQPTAASQLPNRATSTCSAASFPSLPAVQWCHRVSDTHHPHGMSRLTSPALRRPLDDQGRGEKTQNRACS